MFDLTAKQYLKLDEDLYDELLLFNSLDEKYELAPMLANGTTYTVEVPEWELKLKLNHFGIYEAQVYHVGHPPSHGTGRTPRQAVKESMRNLRGLMLDLA